MQKRQKNRKQYFDELAVTSLKYFLPYIQHFKTIEPGMNILEVGCGDGGNLLPFSELGCHTVGVDRAQSRIDDAISFFEEVHAEGRFIASDIFELKELENKFDLIICHDMIEHIGQKELFLSKLKKYLKPDGVIFMSFPAWQMPFGGHQQICKSKILSRLPFIHLLPNFVYVPLLKLGGEDDGCIKELLNIKETRTPIELFEKIRQGEYQMVNRQFYLINPHYEVKFKLRPRKLSRIISSIPYVRDFFTTSCFYILK